MWWAPDESENCNAIAINVLFSQQQQESMRIKSVLDQLDKKTQDDDEERVGSQQSSGYGRFQAYPEPTRRTMLSIISIIHLVENTHLRQESWILNIRGPSFHLFAFYGEETSTIS
ncbi:hypothetical protein Cni_G27013 [Canna indica]|uniref:Uncharacterized protein n=1 Tax=Canna indica TaxID=4628 RepID=A0AAQ3L0R0_9LILI|nr:hypothetical protein Cni_G27013 [Canna indica]